VPPAASLLSLAKDRGSTRRYFLKIPNPFLESYCSVSQPISLFGKVVGSRFEKFLSESEGSDVDRRLPFLQFMEKSAFTFDGDLCDEAIDGPSNGAAFPTTVAVVKELGS